MILTSQAVIALGLLMQMLQALIMIEFFYVSKEQALSDIFDIENIDSIWPKHYLYNNVTSKDLLKVISKDRYSLKELGLNATRMSALLTHLWPEREKTCNKICFYLLDKYDLKKCCSCNIILEKSSFHKNSCKRYGLATQCIPCFNDSVRDLRRNYTAFRKAEKLFRTPSWANKEKIKEIYSNCPDGYHVDHIIPLLGELVSGFHIETNLQYLTIKDNLSKSNKFIPG